MLLRLAINGAGIIRFGDIIVAQATADPGVGELATTRELSALGDFSTRPTANAAGQGISRFPDGALRNGAVASSLANEVIE